ncbi:Farnesylcysteine lyase [Camellia lanceoleosa]|uniref:Farnesylcysteine lyase n=1 Tax=Camellia lanceoleosa TaxID=1840588 RepID=A0ACC0J6N8_9ERIC|nr:Farnesylcysteine lyase [Camellia lanceoleosa]
MAAGLINTSDVELHLNEEIASISYLGDYYELNSTNGNSYTCDISVVATPLDEINIRFTLAFLIPNRQLHHTYATFVRGFLNPAYFGLHSASAIPELVGTVENSDDPFLTISVLKQHNVGAREFPANSTILDLMERAGQGSFRWTSYRFPVN